ncbi:hypothetical protein [Kineococcus sp. SYSU DK003]|uniref:hypothetical protein n=1 Tax=Kineococcus sp. SYSU DK003 TaxID=3383124 RepID=UPI003D7D905A
MSADEHAALPIPDYDHLPVASLAHRVRSLDTAGLDALIEYEEEHGAREPVLTVLRARAEQLAAGAQPSGGDPTAPQPEHAPPADHQGPSSVPGPPQNPPSHGDPTNPSQPRG